MLNFSAQLTNTASEARVPGRATGNFFSVTQSAMLVASGDRAPLEHSLGASQKQSLSQRITTSKIVGSNTSMLTQHKGLWLKSSFRKKRNYQKFVFAKNMLNVHFVNLIISLSFSSYLRTQLFVYC